MIPPHAYRPKLDLPLQSIEPRRVRLVYRLDRPGRVERALDRLEVRLSDRVMVALFAVFIGLIAFVAVTLLYFQFTDPAAAIPAVSVNAAAPEAVSPASINTPVSGAGAAAGIGSEL